MNDRALPRDAPVDQPHAPLCRSCGYDLTGLEAPGTCPECGGRFDELPGDEVITLAWPCLNCGYPLAGFRRNQKCSECAMPVRISVDPALMRFQPRAYRDRLRRGSLLAGLGMVSVIVIPLTIGVVGVFAQSRALMAVLLLIGFLVMYGLFAGGWWMMLASPPSSLGLSDRNKRRVRWTRIALIAFVAISVLGTALEQVAAMTYGSASTLLQILTAIANLSTILVFGAFFVLGLLVLKPLYQRARTSRKRPGVVVSITLWIGIVVIAMFAVAISLTAILVGFNPSGGFMSSAAGGGFVASTLLVMAASIGAIVVFFCYLSSIDGIRSAMKRVNREIALASRHAPWVEQTDETRTPDPPKNDPA